MVLAIWIRLDFLSRALMVQRDYWPLLFCPFISFKLKCNLERTTALQPIVIEPNLMFETKQWIAVANERDL